MVQLDGGRFATRTSTTWKTADGRDRANADPAMQQARQQIIATTGAQAEFANWEVLEQKTTR